MNNRNEIDYKRLVRAILDNKRYELADKINAIKINVQPGNYKDALKMHPLINKNLHKDSFFKTIKEIRQKEAYQFTGDFNREYKWVINLIEPHLDNLNLFIELKNKFETLCIRGEFEKALEIITEVEKQFGISLWSIEANLIIEEFLNGSEANWNKLSNFLVEINNPFYEFIINNSSKRFESKLSHDSYLSQFLNDIDTITIQGIVKDFFVFKNLSFSNYEYNYKKLEAVLYISNIFSIVDQYLLLIDVIIYNISINTETDKYFLQFINLAKDIVTSDLRLNNIYNIINDKKKIIKYADSSEFIKCLDLYYKGDFDNALVSSKNEIINSPTEFENYEIYCKSLINLELEYIPINISSLSENLLMNTYNLLKFEKKKEDSFKKLFKISLIFLNTNLGKQIFALLTEIEGIFNRNYITGFISSKYVSPKFLVLSENRAQVNLNFNSISNSHSINVLRYKLGENIKFTDEISKSNSQVTIFKAQNEFKNKDYQTAISTLTTSKEFITTNFYYHERKVSILYNSYLMLNQLENALLLFTEVFFDETFITRKLNHQELFERLRDNINKSDYSHLIEITILFSLIVKEYDLYEVYDLFLEELQISNISELNIETLINKYSLLKTCYFLNNVCTIDTLKYSTDYGSISEVEEDRIEILKELIRINPSDKLIYEKEINEIYRINSVRKVLKEVDEGRLYIDVKTLKEIQIKKFNDDFIRFKEIEYSASTQPLIAFNAANTKSWDMSNTEKVEPVEKFNGADYLAFKSIYLESRDNFLFSKEYGLDSCLSTRIRHGALKNHIRSVFEKLDLVTSKLNDIYNNNEVWGNQLIFYPEQSNHVQNRLKVFSKEIDTYTVFIVEKLIQIQNEKTVGKEDGLFTFFTNDEILFKFYNINRNLFDSIESTIELILTSLTNRTLVDIQRTIVDYFENNILREYQRIIDSTLYDLRNINLPNDCQLIPCLIKSSTDIQQELESISNWFYLNTTSSTTLLSIETLVDASVELTNKINPNYKIKPIIKLNCEPFGVYSSLVFVFNILFNNIIEHSHLPFDQVNTEIELDIIDEKYIRIKVSNEVNCNYEFAENLLKLKKIKENWNDHTSIERSNKEGESGFDKIKRILLYETFSKTDRFEFEFNGKSICIQLYFPYIKFDYEKNINN